MLIKEYILWRNILIKRSYLLNITRIRTIIETITRVITVIVIRVRIKWLRVSELIITGTRC
jgi:hypothetical protein